MNWELVSPSSKHLKIRADQNKDLIKRTEHKLEKEAKLKVAERAQWPDAKSPSRPKQLFEHTELKGQIDIDFGHSESAIPCCCSRKAVCIWPRIKIRELCSSSKKDLVRSKIFSLPTHNEIRRFALLLASAHWWISHSCSRLGTPKFRIKINQNRESGDQVADTSVPNNDALFSPTIVAFVSRHRKADSSNNDVNFS